MTFSTEVHKCISEADMIFISVNTPTKTCGQYQKVHKDREFKGFTIDDNSLGKADKDAIILPCLPAYRNKEIIDAVIENDKSRILDQSKKC